MFIVLIGSVSTAWFSIPGFQKLNAVDTLFNLLLVQNLTNSPNAIGPLWSLPIEVQMYAFLPAVWLAVRNSFVATVAIYPVTLVLALASFKLHLPEVLRYFPCFFPGVVAFSFIANGKKPVFPFKVIPLVLVGGLVVYFVLGRWSQTIGAYLSCLAIGLTIPFVRESSFSLLNLACEKIAKYSYGIYLLHAPALATTFALPIPIWAKLLTFMAVTGMLSVLAYHAIEEPMVRLGKSATQKMQ